VIAYLRLVRFPNVFTALADIGAGWLIVHAAARGSFTSFAVLDWNTLPLLAGASGALYLSGMAFNDIADRREDAEFRPGRPLPSGALSLRGAVLCAILLTLLGLSLAAAAGLNTLLRAALLACAILQYNFRSKGHLLFGPLTLGFCRFVNVQLGMSAHPAFGALLSAGGVFDPIWSAPLAVGLYSAGLTAFSAQEEHGARARALTLGALLCGSAILWAGLSSSVTAWFALAPLLLVLQFLTLKLRREGTPAAARTLVRTGVMGICVLDAGLVLGHCGPAAWPAAAALFALLLPGLLAARLLAQREA
jgi:4-hydroxybenzoate polyprenyltransferase